MNRRDNGRKFSFNYFSQAAAVIMDIAYGLDVQTEDDPFVEAADTALTSLIPAVTPGSFVVEAMPFRTSSLVYRSKDHTLIWAVFFSQISSLLAPWHRIQEKGRSLEETSRKDGQCTC